MSVRTSMSEIIAQLRLLVMEPGSTLLSDQQVQDILDQHAYRSVYEQTTPVFNVYSGTTEYKLFIAAHQYWENNATLHKGDFTLIASAGYTADFKTGEFTFSASQILPVLTYGTWFDINAAAADAWEMKAANYAAQFDFAVDGGNYSKSQQYTNAMAMVKKFRIKAASASGIGYLTRSDVIGG